MKKLIAIVLVLALAVAAGYGFATNPTLDEFAEWFAQQGGAELGSGLAGDGLLGGLLGSLASSAMSISIIQETIKNSVIQSNFYVFSIFMLDNVKVLGVFDRFYVL
ncbi:MAG: hypothetical protein FWG82_02925 [Oscillospiraceae bacterium]|nr:hypothetical protein [Oscillospiraceae bacterium]